MHEYQRVDSESWLCTDTLFFHLPPAPCDANFDLSVGVRTSDMIDVRDLWLVMESRTDIRHRDTLHILLASDRAHWQTHGVVLHEVEQHATVLHLDSAQKADVLIYHIMSPQSIRGLTEVGIKVSPHK